MAEQTLHSAFDDDVDQQLRALVSTHQTLPEPLHLAVQYAPEPDQGDLFLFELIGGFGADTVDPDRQMMAVSMPGSPRFALPPGRQLHMLLTNAVEFDVALREEWPEIVELQRALARPERFRVLVADAVGQRALARLQS